MTYYEEDWSDIIDDCDNSFWEDYLGGPDDDHFEHLTDYHEDQGNE